VNIQLNIKSHVLYVSREIHIIDNDVAPRFYNFPVVIVTLPVAANEPLRAVDPLRYLWNTTRNKTARLCPRRAIYAPGTCIVRRHITNTIVVTPAPKMRRPNEGPLRRRDIGL